MVEAPAPAKSKRPGKRARDYSNFALREIVAPEGRCASCGASQKICQHRHRPLQTLSGNFWIVAKDRCCSNHEACSAGKVLYRPEQDDSLVLKKCEYGLDVICYIGEQYLRNSTSLPKLHKHLREQGVLISQTHVGNLFRLFLALIKCRDGDDEGLRRRLREQGRLVLSVDAVKLDDVSARLYIVRDILSGEVLFCERIEFADTPALVALLKRVAAIDVPVSGVVSDKEQALVLAVKEVFPGVPHQLCQVHYLKNLVRPMESDLAELATNVKDVVGEVRELEKELAAADDEEMSADERETAQALCFVVKTVGKSRAGDSLMDPPPLRRFRRLTEAAEATKEAVKAAACNWPFVARLLAILTMLQTHGELARRLQQQFAVIHSIAHILNTQAAGSKVKSLLLDYLNKLDKQVQRANPSDPFSHFFGNVTDVTERFWKGLFHCYVHDDIPANNNALEQFNGAIKRQQRRVHGRKSTAGGPLDGCASALLEVWSRLDNYPDLLAIVRGLPTDKLLEVRKEIERLAKPSRLRRSIARNSGRFMKGVLARTTKHE
jgi:hypothetical protein